MRFYIIKGFVNPIQVDAYNKNHSENIIDVVSSFFVSKFNAEKIILLGKTFSGFETLVLSEDEITEDNVDTVFGFFTKEVYDCKINRHVEQITSAEALECDLNKDDLEIVKSFTAQKDETLDEEIDKLISLIEENSEDGSDAKKIDEQDIKKADNDKALQESIANLVGMDELKSWAEKIVATKGNIKDSKLLQYALTSMSYLLVINSGDGCTEAANIIGSVISNALCYDNVKVREYEITFDEKDNSSNVSTILKYIAVSPNSSQSKGNLNVTVIHLNDLINKTGTEDWQQLMIGVRDNRYNSVFIFAVPYLENSQIARIHNKIDDVVCNRVINIPPYSNEIYISMFEKLMQELNLTVNSDVHSVLIKKIAEEKSDGKFYGIKTLKKIRDELVYNKVIKYALGDEENQSVITADDMSELLYNNVDDGIPALDMLDSLVALDNVKKAVREILAMIKMNRSRDTKEKYSMHMMFYGPPGTGKTIVARIIGKLLKEENILSIGDFYEVTRKDLVGTYVGHTAPKTAMVCRNAYGSVLFIDEAYSLYGGDEKDYGKEAISTLIAEMENHRDNFVVIFAGYEEDLEKLFELNSGLRDRIPYRLKFESYNREQLKDIFFMTLPDDFTYDEEFKAYAEEFFRTLPDEIINSHNFSNGRYVRNIVERIISKMALRTSCNDDCDGKRCLLKVDFELAVNDINYDAVSEEKAPRTIGFLGAI